MGDTIVERIEVRRLAAWFDGKFASEVTQNLLGEKYMRQQARRGAIPTGQVQLAPQWQSDYGALVQDYLATMPAAKREASGEIPFPRHTAILCVEAEHRNAARLVARASDE